ncbi:MAG: C10 family peptidase, partial [Bacteroidales bacterium]|nr:C10 family peptidase [Bacteroidales bacterium]
MKKQTVLGVLLLFVMFCFNAKAEVITVEGASEIANAFFTQSARSQKTQLKSATQLEYAWDSNSLTQSGSSMLKSVEEDPTFYVFNNPDGEGFVIVSGDSNTRSIIGYSYEGNAPAVTDIPLPMQDYLSGIDAEVKYARENITSTGNNLKNYNENIAGTPIVEIETAKWGQGAPFNNLCPVVQVYDSNSNIIETSTLTGCVPTAFSIVMRYHEWPIQGKGSIVASWTVDQYNGYNPTNCPVVTIDHTATTYDWDNMPLEYSANWTQENITQVATLMRNVGYAFGVTYTPGNTSITDGDLPEKIKTCFDYTIETTVLGNYNVPEAINDISEWKEKLKRSLDNDCPIPYAAKNSGTGDSRHMFVVDGYTNNDYFHFNFGWKGNGNGWFTIDAITPSTGDNYSWTDSGSEHRAYINFKPNKQVTVSVAADPDTAGSVTIDGESVTSKVVEAGSTVELEATATGTAQFVGWYNGNISLSSENPYSTTITRDVTYTAKFSDNPIELSVGAVAEDLLSNTNANNKVEPSAATVCVGDIVNLKAQATRGYRFDGWYAPVYSMDAPISTQAETSITIISEYASGNYLAIAGKFSQLSPIQPTVVSSNSDMGSASYSITAGTQELYAGEEITLVATPKSGYMFTGWSDGTSTISTSKTYTVAVEEGKTYTANFALSGADY